MSQPVLLDYAVMKSIHPPLCMFRWLWLDNEIWNLICSLILYSDWLDGQCLSRLIDYTHSSGLYPRALE